MKTITIRELHGRTWQLVRAASRYGEIRETSRGRVIAKIVPEAEHAAIPCFARRKTSPAFRRLYRSGRFGTGGTDVTQSISEEWDGRL